ncbi:polysialyltransferase family glycosyltransferase [Clostridium tarantellae]|uniref:Uncharacterized protein n=1 Tax=Clostridium tarantellae TaxID=39493 RepID=A0A6I1MTC9_9CLOT|nr:polysialyltransferase family glycosyltransferase [Clostridium tarantellae]MPQ43499.1 hypothetical protein [Clostridium tarantellae]
MMKNNLFLAHTPYHLLLSATLVKQENLKNNVLVIFKDFNINMDEYKWLNDYFHEIIILRGSYKLNYTRDKLKTKIGKMVYVRGCALGTVFAIKKLIKSFKDISWSQIFCFNDSFEKIQILIHNLKGENTKVAYIEDGSAAYWVKKDIFLHMKINASKFLSTSYIMLKSFNFHDKYEIIDVFGGGSYIDYSYFLYPDFICKELKKKEAKEIKSEDLKTVILRKNFEKFNINNSIVILADLYSPKVKEYFEEAFKYLKGYNIYLKYHPRETNFYLNDLVKGREFILPSEEALESILVNSKNNIIIGTGGSTVFFTLPKISENKYISLNKIFNISFGEEYEKTLEKIGINIPLNYEEFNIVLERSK